MLQAGALAFAAGILLLQTRAVLPPALFLLGLPLTLIGLLFYRRRVVVITCCLLTGFLWAHYQARELLQQRLPPDTSQHRLLLQGFVSSLPQRQGERTQFEFDVTGVISPVFESYPHRIRLSWYSRTPPDLRPGQAWRLRVRLRNPHSFMDPGAFDYTAWLLQKGIVATGYVDARAENRLLASGDWRYPVQSLRYRLRAALREALHGQQSAGLVVALVIGDRSGVSPQQWALLQKTGTVHLMAISGLHIGLIAGLVFLLVNRLWRFNPAWCLWLAAPRAAAVFSWLAAAAYAALAGFSIPTQRALIMLAVLMLAVYLQRLQKPGQILALALFAVLIWDPFSVLSVGFWLSFGAVALIYYLLLVQTPVTSRLRRWWRMQLGISLGLMPMIVLFFQQAPLVSPLSNLVAIPWISLLVLPLTLLATVLLGCYPPLGVWGLSLAGQLLDMLQNLLAWLSQVPMSLVMLPSPSPLALLLALGGIGVLLLPRGIPARFLGLLLCLPLVVPAANRPPAGEAQLDLLDVGQGLCAVVQTARHTLVFDTGPRFSPGLDAGRAVLVPFLRRQGISRVDTLLVSHGDRDHIGGARSLLRQVPVRRILSIVPAIRRGGQDAACLAGTVWRWDGVEFRVLYPSPGDLERMASDNNRSCVLQVSTGTRRILLTADIEARAETILRRRYGAQLRSAILVVAHHGSKTSSSAAFVDAVHPTLALIPAGWHNRYGFPATPVLDRLHDVAPRVMSTSNNGAIRVETGSRLQVSAYREQYRRYWQSW